MRVFVNHKTIINILRGSLSYYCIFAILLSPPYLQFFPLLNNVVNVLRVLVFVLLFYNFVVSDQKETIAIAVTCWQLLYLFSALINAQVSMSFWYYFINRIGAVLFTIEGVKKNAKRFFLSGRNYLLVLLIINLFMVVFSLGQSTALGTYYLFGLRIGISIHIVLALLLSLLYDYCNSEKTIKLGTTTITIAVVSAISFAFLRAVTGMIGIIVMILMYFLLSHNKIRNRKVLFLVPIVLFILIVITEKQLNILGFILNYFGKDLTFTGRTRIWAQALQYISEHPLIGHGTNTMPINWVYSTIMQPAHNEILNDVYFAGLFTLPFLYYCTIGFIDSSTARFINDLYVSVIFGLSLMMITEIQSDYASFFVIISLGYMIFRHPDLIENKYLPD